MILKLADEEEKRGENQERSTFSETQQVMTTRCTVPFFWVNSKCQVYIGNLESEDSPKFQEISIISLGFSGTKLSYKTGFSYGLHSPMTYIRMSPALHLQFG
jgi:hypothetical protein